MMSSMFDASTLPLLEQVVNFTEARHGVLAGNIANLDTPGYRTREFGETGGLTSNRQFPPIGPANIAVDQSLKTA